MSDLGLFTSGRVFLPSEEGPLPVEREMVAAVLAGERRDGLSTAREVDVYDAKGVALELVERVLRRPGGVVVMAAAEAPHLHPRGLGAVEVDGRRVAIFGMLHPDVADRLDLGGSAAVVEVDVDALSALGSGLPQFTPIPTLPPVMRDLALVVDERVTSGELEATIAEAAGELCESVELFDRFTGKGVPEGQVSLAYHLVFRDPKAALAPSEARTLTDKEVEALTKQVVAAVTGRHAAAVRGG